MRKKFFPLLFSALGYLPFFGAQREIKTAHEPPAIIDSLATEISARLPEVADIIKRVVVPLIKNKHGHSRKLINKINRARKAA